MYVLFKKVLKFRFELPGTQKTWRLLWRDGVLSNLPHTCFERFSLFNRK